MKRFLTIICLLFAAVSPAFADSLSGLVRISATAIDNVGVVSVQLQVDGVNYGPMLQSAPYTFTWDSRTAPDGTHTLAVLARDAAGNVGSQSTSVTVDNSPPSVSLIAPTADAFVSGSGVQLTASANDNVAIAGVQFQVDGQDISFSRGRSNVAAAANGGSVIASSAPPANYPASAAIDGDRKGLSWGSGGGWSDATPGTFPDFLEISFGATKIINEVALFTLQDDYANPVEPYLGLTFTKYGVTAFQVLYWDGQSWTLVPGANISGNNQVWRQIMFAPVSTSRIRIYITGSVDQWSRLTEVEAYSTGIAALGEVSPYSISWDSTAVPNGFHSLTATSRDEAGNFITSQPISVLVSNGNGLPGPPFVKSGPANGAASVTGSAALSWEAFSGASSYEYCVDTTNNNSCDTSWTSTAGNNAAIGGLVTGTTYYWQVRARNSAGTVEANAGAWSTFTTLRGGVVNVAAAINGAVASASSFANSRYAPDSAINGDRRGTGWGSGGGWNDGTPDSFPDWLQVDFASPQSINEVDVFTLQDNVDNPVEPFMGQTFSQYGVTDFQIQYWDGFSWTVVPAGTIDHNNQVWRQVTFAPVTTTRIRIYITGALSTWSRITEVEAYAESGPPPGPMVKISPANGAAGQALGPALTWGASNGATRYEYCIDTINNNTCDSIWLSTNATSVGLSGLSAGKTYWWQVRARNDSGSTDADSGIWSSLTAPAARVNFASRDNGAVASASSFKNTGFAPSGTIDGDRKGTGWGNAGGWNDGTPDSFPDWLLVDFAGPQTIAEVDVFTLQDNVDNPVEPFMGQTFSQYGITDFQVQYWDGFSWTVVPAGTIVHNNQVWRQVTFAPVTTTRIRIYIIGALNSWSRITEVEAYADSGLPGPMVKISPVNGAAGEALGPALTWGASNGATRYEYCIDTINNNTCDSSWLSTTAMSVALNGLSSGYTYWWQVRALNDSGSTDADNGTWWSLTAPAGR